MKKEVICVFTAFLTAVCFWGCKEEQTSIDLEEVLQQMQTVSTSTGEPVDETESTWEEEPVLVWVHICGEVMVPGVYEMTLESRIYDVLMAAGGFTEEADEQQVNLAAVVSDGMQIYIPAEGERVTREDGSQEGLVNINTASVAELCTLPGIGESKAEAIIVYREANGGFQSKEDIMKVSGIKQSAYAKIKDKITVG